MEAFCFVCRRCTDHFAEHDDLVEAGLAVYDEDSGDVCWSAKAAAMSESELEAALTALSAASNGSTVS
jgi:hypothetical protein